MIAQAEQELNWNKSSLMHYITIKNLNITEKDIDDLAEKNFVENQKGDIDTKVTIDKHIANINRQINSCENSIADNMIKTNDIGREEPSVSIQEQDKTTPKGQETSTKTQETSNTEHSQSMQQQPPYNSSNQQQSLVPQNDIRWYQFIQRFKNWRAEKKYKKEEMIKNQKLEDLNESLRKVESLEKLKQLIDEKPEVKKSLETALEAGKKANEREENTINNTLMLFRVNQIGGRCFAYERFCTWNYYAV